jgi:hypothetical protein
MKIINTFTGKEVAVGQSFQDPIVGKMKLLHVESKGLLSARALIQFPNGDRKVTPLIVRLTHPSFFLQRVAFIPT